MVQKIPEIFRIDLEGVSERDLKVFERFRVIRISIRKASENVSESLRKFREDLKLRQLQIQKVLRRRKQLEWFEKMQKVTERYIVDKIQREIIEIRIKSERFVKIQKNLERFKRDIKKDSDGSENIQGRLIK